MTASSRNVSSVLYLYEYGLFSSRGTRSTRTITFWCRKPNSALRSYSYEYDYRTRMGTRSEREYSYPVLVYRIPNATTSPRVRTTNLVLVKQYVFYVPQDPIRYVGSR
eukprot:scaffold21475_cov17-Prasinocladus_malaysianus.AAC.1